MGFEHRQFIVGMCRADVFELFDPRCCEYTTCTAVAPEAVVTTGCKGAHKVQSYRRPRASPLVHRSQGSHA